MEKNKRNKIDDEKELKKFSYNKHYVAKNIKDEIKYRTPPYWEDFFKENYILIKYLYKSLKKECSVFYPPIQDVFRIFHLVAPSNIKVVIIGQDPYHREGEAMGMSFSVRKGIKVPPSLNNVYKELENNIDGFKKPNHGDLTGWAKQGVFLINKGLTVLPHKPASHLSIWEPFFTKLIGYICSNNRNTIFCLWGKKAQDVQREPTFKSNNVLVAGHPSPLNSTGTFIGCGHFSKINSILRKNGKGEINWQL